MYIWVILATFIAMLAAYSIPAREDIRKVTVEPLAEAQVAKMVTKHRAAVTYANMNIPPNTPANNVTFKLGVLAAAQIDKYKPYGYILDYTNYPSYIYCISPDWKTVYNTVAQCDDPLTSRFVITYGVIPQRWLNVESGMPTNDYINAMMTTVNSKTRFGYGKYINASDTISYDYYVDSIRKSYSGKELTGPLNISQSPMKIVGREDAHAYIPAAIVTNLGLTSKCANGKYCLIYLSSI